MTGSLETSPNTGRRLCIWSAPDIEHKLILVLSTLLDVFMTAFLLYLYGKPMMAIVRHSKQRHKGTSSRMSPNELKSQRCIQVNFVCSSVSTLHTALVALA